MIDAVFFDIDGTLIPFETHKMSEATIEALKAVRAKGVKLFIATGRHISEMEELKKYPYFDGYITLNGCYCYNDDGVYYKMPLLKEDVNLLIDKALEMTIPLALIDEFTMTVNYLDDYVVRAANYADVPIPKVQDPKLLRDQELYQAVLYGGPQEEDELLNAGKALTASRWHPDFVDIGRANTSKSGGIIKTCEIYGFDIQNCMAFGDGGNDIPMLETVGIGIAMGNAKDDVKAIAKEVTLDAIDDGIIASFKKHGLL